MIEMEAHGPGCNPRGRRALGARVSVTERMGFEARCLGIPEALGTRASVTERMGPPTGLTAAEAATLRRGH